jgi:hypothetical protein
MNQAANNTTPGCALGRTSVVRAMMVNLLALIACFSGAELCAAGDAQASNAPLRVGIIGLDTSHAIAFTTLLNAEAPRPELAGCRVVAAYPQGSLDIPSSVERVPKYTAEVQKMGVEIVDSIPALLEQVDVVLLESNDGRVHLEQAIPVLEARKRMFIDKPMAHSLADVLAIFEVARRTETPIFSTSALRYGPGTQAAREGKLGDIVGCDTFGSCALEPTHPDLFWYGIHGVESLFTVMGPGCESVSRTTTPDCEFAVGVWSGGRVGTFRGMRKGAQQFGGTAFGVTANGPAGELVGYEPLVVDIVKFFRGAEPPVDEEETLEVFAFMEAADESKRLGGQPVAIPDILSKARQAAQQRLSEQYQKR